MNAIVKLPIIPREKLDFGLDAGIPRYWMGGDAFRTRLMDAMFVSFPEGERFFMSSVRHFRERVTDPALQEEIKAFNRQEAQHGIVHSRFNDLLRRQGLPIDAVEGKLRRQLAWVLERRTPEFNLAVTAACEHLTALMAEAFFSDPETMKDADPRVRAMMAWHAMEEMEHKAVAFDTMSVAGIGHGLRVRAMLFITVMFTVRRLRDANIFLKADGFSRRERLVLMGKGLWWVFGPKGVLSSMRKPWRDYFRRDFHPWQHDVLPQYRQWLEVYTRTGDPVAAGEALFATQA